MTVFAIHELALGPGKVALCPAPGRYSPYARDLATILAWQPEVVLSMTEAAELEGVGAAGFVEDLAGTGVSVHRLPIRDFGAPGADTLNRWQDASRTAHSVLRRGGRVLSHCFGGCGRSGMAVLRLMVEFGESPSAALDRLRAVRSCAVETDAQFDWAASARV